MTAIELSFRIVCLDERHDDYGAFQHNELEYKFTTNVKILFGFGETMYQV